MGRPKGSRNRKEGSITEENIEIEENNLTMAFNDESKSNLDLYEINQGQVVILFLKIHLSKMRLNM